MCCLSLINATNHTVLHATPPHPDALVLPLISAHTIQTAHTRYEKVKPMTLRAATATAALLLSTLLATAQQQFTDPANLRGERVKPRDGRELPIDRGARGLEQLLRKLNTRASLMLIVAHPDDEDGGMLTYYSRGLGARVAVLTLTRGEGGQNAMTGDFEDALGLLRTEELLSADRYLGVDQFFGTEVDFGFSKTKEEAFKKWTHERVLYDAVRSIRLYRPLVIAAVFIGGVTDGHGQHQVSGQIAQEAFKAAADPTVFPDMIAEGILPWQALKIYARVPMQSISDKGLFDYATGKYTAPRFENYVTGEVTTTPPSVDVVVHEGTIDPILSDSPADPPRTYVQFARIGLGLQKSQIGPNVRLPPAGTFDVSYHLYGSALCTSTGSPKLLGEGRHPNAPPQSRHPERSEGPATPNAAASPLNPSSHNPESGSFFQGIDTSIEGIADLAPAATGSLATVLKTNLAGIAHSISEAQLDLKPGHPELAANRLSEAFKLTDMTIENVASFKAESIPIDQKQNVLRELRIKRVQLNNALVLALGLQFASSMDTAGHGDLPVYHPLSVETRLTGQANAQAKPLREWLQSVHDTEEDRNGGSGKSSWDVSGTLPISQTLEYPYSGLNRTVTRPYFHRITVEQPVYDLMESDFRNSPAFSPALSAWAALDYEGAELKIGSVVRDGIQPIRFVTDENIQLSGRVLALPAGQRTVTISVVDASLGANWRFAGFEGALEATPLSPADESGSMYARSYRFTIPESAPRSTFLVTADAARFVGYSPTHTSGQPQAEGVQARGPAEGYRAIGYGDLPRTNYYTPATVRIVSVDMDLPHATRIAYLPGTGDAVPEALASINLKPDILTIADLTPAKLSQYETVVLGVRTYNAHPDLHGAPTQALLAYARDGGNILVQYQTAEFTAADAPYPLSLGSNEKVVDETDPVHLLEPSSPLLTTPNKITPADFNNWVEERGHGFVETWDPHYTALTETNDPDQDPQRGGLITTNVGKGRWTYCAFALYRQLPEAVPGAYRLFVNLLRPSR